MPIRAQDRPGVRARVRRTSRARALTLAVVTSLLAVPALAQAAANPLTFDYSNSTAITAYAHPTGAVVVGRSFNNPALVDQIQNGGGEVYQYVNVIDGFWENQATATGEQAALYGGPHNNPAWVASPKRYNWPDTPMMDMRPGSPWIIHAVEHIKQWLPTTHSKGVFLDVVGERLWSGAWSQMSASEQAAWTAGNRDFVHRLRVALGPSVIIVANNIWANGNPDLNGITVEHHSFSEASHWTSMTARADWFKPTRNMVIANSTSEGQQWANVAGVTHVSAQATYGGPAAPIVPFSLLPGTVPGQDVLTPAAAPAPAPVVLPPPTPKSRPVLPAVPRKNLLTNPSFETKSAPWTTQHASLRLQPLANAPQGDNVARVSFSGVGSAYSLGRSSRQVAASSTSSRLKARVYVRAGSRSTVGKPMSLYIREMTPAGKLVQRVRAKTVRLGTRFTAITATLTPKSARNKVDILLVQRRAVPGNLFLADALSLTASN
jgi:hypothetical protein